MASESDVQYIRYYTVGSAARELAPQVPQRTKAAPRPRKQKKIVLYIDPVAIVGVVTAVVMMIVMILGMVHLNQVQSQAAAMDSYVEQLTAENALMTEQYASGYDLADVEQTAVALGMVPADQVSRVQLGE